MAVDPLSVRDTRVVVTGAASGIGQAITRGMAARGARVHAMDVDLDRVQAVALAAVEAGLLVTAGAANVSDESSVEAGFDRATDELGGIDVVFANAGIAGAVGPIAEWTLAQWREVLSVNLDGAFLTARAAIRRMTPLAGKKLIFTASVWGERGSMNAQCPGYAASKAGVVGLTKQLAADLSGDRVTVNAIAPSGFVTDIAGGMMRNAQVAAPMLARQPWNCFVGPDAAVGTAVFLASAASDHMTGHLLALDGGYLAV